MIGKKLMAILFGLLMLGMPLTVGNVSAAEGSVTVILVSDNAADKAIAEYLANETGAVIVTTTWGVYDPNVTAEIMSYAPDEVIIIGGPDAVVDEYVTDLEELNITVERWGGQNRYETNLMVMEQAQVKLGLRFNNSVIVAGNDTLAIQNALQLAVQKGAMIIYVNESSNVTGLMERLGIKEMTMVKTQASEKVMEHVREQLRECNCTAKEVQVNVTKETVLQLMIQVMERLKALEMVANETNSTALMEQVRTMEMTMEKVNEALQAGNYTEAYRMVLELQVKTEFSLKAANGEMRMVIKNDEKVALMHEMGKLEAQISVMENAGIDVSAINALMEQLKTAIQNGQYEEAKELMNQIKAMIKEAYQNGRQGIRDSTQKAHGMGSSRP
ncbi:cell wall-binding repeat-containing protein [Thermococcus sp. ES12]|uniref:cell wall-binding repeat-containing protein n=1 Tax=Thermococcus sp. ES12 TaxID=1638246 RepID=UPI00142FE902|nr:cell wall-binding repeat-containing protein [Thermococcus sp. ES12]NJE77364.1 cell wall-binding repeat 2 family protein [Thermococcus sp. ES12]